MPSTISKDENLLTYKGARLYYTIYPSKYEPDEEPYIFIHMIKVPEESRGLGYASILLKQVIDYADRNQLLIQLEVPWIEYDNTGLSVDELEAWYGRYGFIYDGNLFFNREPRKIRRENTMRKIEQGYKDIEWDLYYQGKVDASVLLSPQDEIDVLNENIRYEVAGKLGTFDEFDEYETHWIDITHPKISVALTVYGWHSLSFSAKSVIIYDIIDAIEQGEIQGSFTVPDFFDEEYEEGYE